MLLCISSSINLSFKIIHPVQIQSQARSKAAIKVGPKSTPCILAANTDLSDNDAIGLSASKSPILSRYKVRCGASWHGTRRRPGRRLRHRLVLNPPCTLAANTDISENDAIGLSASKSPNLSRYKVRRGASWHGTQRRPGRALRQRFVSGRPHAIHRTRAKNRHWGKPHHGSVLLVCIS